MSKIAQSFSQKKVMPKKLVMGFLVAAATVLIGTAGVANATTNGNGYGGNTNTNVNVNVNGNNNVIHLVINYFLGSK